MMPMRSLGRASMNLRVTSRIALINCVGNLGGFVGPYLVGWIRQSTGSFSAGMGALALGAGGGAVLVLMLSGRGAARR